MSLRTVSMLAWSMLALAWLAPSCARPQPEAAAPRRMPDSTPEQAAALRAADPRLRSEDEEARWGIEGARERKRQEQQRAAGEPTGPGGNRKAASRCRPRMAARPAPTRAHGERLTARLSALLYIPAT